MRGRIAVILAAAGAALLPAYGQDQPLPVMLAKTSKLSNYSFHIKGTQDDITGEFEKGFIHMVSKGATGGKGKANKNADTGGAGAEVAGKGQLTIGNTGGTWDLLANILPRVPKDGPMARLANVMPAHLIISSLPSYCSGFSAGGGSYTASLDKNKIEEVLKFPWMSNLGNLGNPQGTVTLTVTDGVVTRAEIKIDGTNTAGGRYRGAVRPQTKSQAKSVTIEITSVGSAKISDDVKKKIPGS